MCEQMVLLFFFGWVGGGGDVGSAWLIKMCLTAVQKDGLSLFLFVVVAIFVFLIDGGKPANQRYQSTPLTFLP